MEDINILKFKLNEYKESLIKELAELKAVSGSQEKDDLRAELAQLNKRLGEVKARIKEIKQAPKANKAKIVEIEKKLKAVNQFSNLI